MKKEPNQSPEPSRTPFTPRACARLAPAGPWLLFYDTLDHWVAIYDRLHGDTITLLPRRPGRPVPNLEHTLLHSWTLLTAVVTAAAFFSTR